MNNHSFDVGVATKYGINAAVIFQDMGYWCEHSRINNKNFHDGRYWTFNSISALGKHYPYLSTKAIRLAIQRLIDAGLLVTGTFNALPFDRTMWYALTEEGEILFQNGNVDFPKKANVIFPKRQISTSQKGEPIPYSLYSYPDTESMEELKDTHKARKGNGVDIPGFDDFWNVYPNKVKKNDAKKIWNKLKPDNPLLQAILKDIDRRVRGEWKNIDKHYIPHPTTYLNQRRWEDEPYVKEDEPIERDPDVAEIMRRSMGN